MSQKVNRRETRKSTPINDEKTVTTRSNSKQKVDSSGKDEILTVTNKGRNGKQTDETQIPSKMKKFDSKKNSKLTFAQDNGALASCSNNNASPVPEVNRKFRVEKFEHRSRSRSMADKKKVKTLPPEDNQSPKNIVCGPSIHDGVLVTVNTDEFDLPESILNFTGTDHVAEDGMADSDESDVEQIVEVPEQIREDRICPEEGSDMLIGTTAGNVSKEEQFKKMLADPTMKRVFDSYIDSRIHDIRTDGKTAKGKIANTPALKVVKNLVVKSPSDTTLYTPAFKKSTQESNNSHVVNVFNTNRALINQQHTHLLTDPGQCHGDRIVDKVSDFVDAMRLEAEQHDLNEPQPGTSRKGNNVPVVDPDYELAKKRAQHEVVESEKLKANVAVPPGEDRMFHQVVTSLGMNQGILERNENVGGNPHFCNLNENNIGSVSIPRLVGDGFGLSDDDFFHLTCHIDVGLRQKIEKGHFVDLEKLLPKSRSRISDDTRMEWVHRDGGTFLVPASDNNVKINGIRKWDQAFRVYANHFLWSQSTQI